MLGVPDPLITLHRAILALGRTPEEQCLRYRNLVQETVEAEETEAIRRHIQHQHPYGSDRFHHAIEAQLGRTIGPKRTGRPRKQPAAP